MDRPFDPFRSLEAIQDELNRLFGDDLGAREPAGRWSPPVDIYEADDHYVLQAEVPGLTTESLEVQVNDNQLHLRGERHPYSREVDQFHLMECPHGPFSRSFQFPVSLQASQTKAKLTDGILTLYLPKQDAETTRKIRIG
jgi:HSP20 family protein